MNQDDNYSTPSAALITSEPGVLASRWARLGGSLIDAIVMMLIIVPYLYITGFFATAMTGVISIPVQIMNALVGLAAYLLINAYWLKRDGQTVGKKIVGTRIVSVDTDEILPLISVILKRFLPITVLGYIPFIGGLVYIVDALFVFRSDKRCVHDLIAGTKVVTTGR